MGVHAKPTENSTDFAITQEMVDIARESIASEEDSIPEQPTRIRFRWPHAIWALIMLVIYGRV